MTTSTATGGRERRALGRRSRWRIATALCVLVAPLRPASAHELKLESLMNAFVKVEPREAHLVIPLPLHVTTTSRCPQHGAPIDVANVRPARQRPLAPLA